MAGLALVKLIEGVYRRMRVPQFFCFAAVASALFLSGCAGMEVTCTAKGTIKPNKSEIVEMAKNLGISPDSVSVDVEVFDIGVKVTVPDFDLTEAVSGSNTFSINVDTQNASVSTQSGFASVVIRKDGIVKSTKNFSFTRSGSKFVPRYPAEVSAWLAQNSYLGKVDLDVSLSHIDAYASLGAQTMTATGSVIINNKAVVTASHSELIDYDPIKCPRCQIK